MKAEVDNFSLNAEIFLCRHFHQKPCLNYLNMVFDIKWLLVSKNSIFGLNKSTLNAISLPTNYTLSICLKKISTNRLTII